MPGALPVDSPGENTLILFSFISASHPRDFDRSFPAKVPDSLYFQQVQEDSPGFRYSSTLRTVSEGRRGAERLEPP